MEINDVLDNIISALRPEDLEPEFIIMAKIKDFDGNEEILRGEKLREFLSDPNRPPMAEAKVILDLKKIKIAIFSEVNYFFERVKLRTQDASKD